MLKHPTFFNKRILVLIAHPDDESLYFAGGLQALSKISQITVLSATYTKFSQRGRELMAVCREVSIPKCDFLNLPDKGLRSIISDLELNLTEYLRENDFDLVITHPPHGGEKPHPHHLQVFVTALSLCLQKNRRFAFFSECEASMCEPRLSSEILKLNVQSMLNLYLFKTFFFLNWKSKWPWIQIVSHHFFNAAIRLKRKLFVRFEIISPLDRKQALLQLHRTQQSVLNTYQTSLSGQEFLFLMTGNKQNAQEAEAQSTETIASYHEFKNTTPFGLVSF